MKTKWCQNTKVVPFLIMTRPTQKFHFLQTECTIIVPWKTCINRRQQILKLNFILSKKAVSCAALLSAMLLRAFCPLIWFRLSNVLDSPLNFEGRYIAHLTGIKCCALNRNQMLSTEQKSRKLNLCFLFSGLFSPLSIIQNSCSTQYWKSICRWPLLAARCLPK